MAGRTNSSPSRNFGRQDRLLQSGEFAAAMASRSRLFGDCFELRYRNRPSADETAATGQARLGLIIPKRLVKRAVLRNLLKRLAREAFRHSQWRSLPLDIVLRLDKSPLARGQQVDAQTRRAWRMSLDTLLARVAR